LSRGRDNAKKRYILYYDEKPTSGRDNAKQGRIPSLLSLMMISNHGITTEGVLP